MHETTFSINFPLGNGLTIGLDFKRIREEFHIEYLIINQDCCCPKK